MGAATRKIKKAPRENVPPILNRNAKKASKRAVPSQADRNLSYLDRGLSRALKFVIPLPAQSRDMNKACEQSQRKIRRKVRDRGARHPMIGEAPG
jgi:hypothetical protein